MGLKKEAGQTVVEYILLLAVILSLIGTFYRSDLYKKLFGKNGILGQSIKTKSEFAYRHAYAVDRRSGNPSTDISKTNRDPAVHPSYIDPSGGVTRFFSTKDPYPK